MYSATLISQNIFFALVLFKPKYKAWFKVRLKQHNYIKPNNFLQLIKINFPLALFSLSLGV